MKCDEIFAALAMLEKERGISQTFMMDKIVQALTTAYKRDHEGVENVVVDVDEGKRELKMFVQKEVVEEVENPGTQMSLDEAKAVSAKYNVGDIVNLPVDNIEFGRIAAGNGKQVIIQGLREAESGMVYDEYNSKQHEILTGVVTRIDPRTGNASLRIGTGTEATDALLLAGAELVGIVILLPLQTHQLQHIGDAAADLLGRSAHGPHGQRQVVEHRAAGDQAEVLEDHADGAAHQGKLLLLDAAHGKAVDHHAAAGGYDLTGQQLDNGGFPAAGRPHQEHKFSVIYLK